MTSLDGSRPPDTIVLIHGPWLTPRSWEGWARRYSSRGYRVLAPAWPGMEAEVEALNADPSPIASLTVERVVDHYEQLVLDLDRPPLIVGHSLGGTFTEILLDRGLGAAGLGIASATVMAIDDLRLPVAGPVAPGSSRLAGGELVALTSKEFHDLFTHTMGREESDAIHARYHVPAPTAMLRKDSFTSLRPEAVTQVDPRRERRAPLLLIRFGADRVVPPSVVGRGQECDGDVAVVELAGRPHYPAAPGWEGVADRALEWLVERAGGR